MKKFGYLPYVEFQSSVSVYPHRVISNLLVPFPRTNAVKANVLNCIPKIWNEIPGSICVGELPNGHLTPIGLCTLSITLCTMI